MATPMGLAGITFSTLVSALEFDESKYEVYYGDFNSDGNANDIYYHHKDLFVLIHGSIAIPLFTASDESFVGKVSFLLIKR